MKPFKNILFAVLVLIADLAYAGEGWLSVLVSRQGQPLANYSLTVSGGGVIKTDKRGVATLQLQEGEIDISVPLGENEKKILKANIVADEETQVIVNLVGHQLEMDLSEPEAQTLDLENSETENFTGQVKSLGNDQPVAGVRIFVKGASGSAVTNGKGEFELRIPKGENTFSFVHPKYNTLIKQDVKGQAENEPLQFRIVPTGLELEDFVVLAPRKAGSVEALIELRKKSSNVSDVISAEQIAKTGDSDAASSLSRVTGLTLVDGKYVYVRGLGERYSNTLVNGVAVPSPDPSRRVVPLDLFPVGVLESLIIQKSYSPDRTGEFGGGTILLKLNSFPKKRLFKASISESIHAGAKGSDQQVLPNSNHWLGSGFQSYQGGGQDWLGYDDGTRALPSGLSGKALGGLEALNELPNNHNLQFGRPNQLPGLSFVYGNGYRYGKFRFSHLTSGLYSHDYKITGEKAFKYLKSGSTYKVNDAKTKEISGREVKLGALVGLGLSYKKTNKIGANYLLARRTTDKTTLSEGKSSEDDVFRDTELKWTERQLQTLIVDGEHTFNFLNKSKLNWHWSGSEAILHEPDYRSYRYVLEDDRYIFDAFRAASSYSRVYSDLTEDVGDVGLSFTVPFTIWNNRQANISVGVGRIARERASQIKRFSLSKTNKSYNDYGVNLSDPLEKIVDACVPNCLEYKDQTSDQDAYDANQFVDSYYLDSKWQVLNNVEVSAGARLETSDQSVSSFNLYQPTKTKTESRLTTRDVLPSTNISWNLTKKMKVRLAYSETVSRPDFKELSNTLWKDDDRGFDVVGNPELRAAVIRNTDLRWEWYFARKENVSIGIFSKNFETPIEESFKGASDPVVTFNNADRAENYGIEFEFSKNLAFLSTQLSQLNFSGNVSLIESEIHLDNLINSDLTSKKRPLQGQSPYVVNAMIDYEMAKSMGNISLVYNLFGPRIAQVGRGAFPDIYEEPFQQLDFVFVRKVKEIYSIKLKIQNLLNENSVFVQDGNVTKLKEKGQSLGLSLSMSI